MYYDLLINNGKYDKLISILPEYFEALDISKDLIKAQVYNEVAFKLSTQGELLDRAVELGEKALEIVNNHKNNQYDLEVKKWETNIDIFLASIEDTLGLAFFELDEYDKAEKYLVGAIKYLNTASEPHYHLGLVYEKKGNYKKAYREFLFAKYLVGTEVDEYKAAIKRVSDRAFEDEDSRKDFNENVKKEVKELKGISEKSKNKSK
jgi:tetratricopeptide (TPR) repeat protein